MLESLGLSATAEAVYRVMLSNPGWRRAEICDHLRLTDRQVRAALDELADLALLRHAEDGPPVAVAPALGLASLLARAEAEVRHRQNQIDATRAAIAAIAAEQEATRERDVVTRLTGVDSVRSRIAELAAAVRDECVSFNPGSAQTPDAKAASRPLNEEMLLRGVAIRCVYQDSFRNDPALLGYARWLQGLGGEPRTSPTLPMLMIVFDRQTALLPLDLNDTRRGAIEVRSAGVVAATYALFEQVWAAATPFGEVAVPDEHGLQPTERELLGLLAAGMTDEGVARKLGVSLRTVRRMTAELMERLDARSRFQLGVKSAQRGWLWAGTRPDPALPAELSRAVAS